MVPETRYARVGDGHIAYQVVGDGPIDLVWVGAWFSHSDGRWEWPSWASFWYKLASFSRLILFDRRGTGASDPLPSDDWTWEEWVEDLLAVMDAAGSERAALAANADGGATAILCAASHPERVSALILSNTSARFMWAEDYPQGASPEFRDALIEGSVAAWGTDALIDMIAPSLADNPRFREWWGRYQRMSGSPRMNRMMLERASQTDVRHVLPTISVPTLVLPKKDFAFQAANIDHARYLAENIPGARLVELEGADAILHLGDQDAAVDEIAQFLTGVRRDRDVDRVLSTVMFTDIVDAPELAASLGDQRWRDLLDTHDRVVRRLVGEYRGRLLRLTPEGIMATFDGPNRAIRCALAARDELQSIGLQIRAGLHTGEVEVRGDEVDGIGVHIAHRVMTEAAPDQVLVSGTVKDLVAGSDLEFTECGVRELKGVPGTWRLLAVVP